MKTLYVKYPEVQHFQKVFKVSSFISQVHNSDLLNYQKKDQFEFPPSHIVICFMLWTSKLASCTLPKFDYILKWFTNVVLSTGIGYEKTLTLLKFTMPTNLKSHVLSKTLQKFTPITYLNQWQVALKECNCTFSIQITSRHWVWIIIYNLETAYMYVNLCVICIKIMQFWI